jgi:hypothetical protein
MSAAPPLDLLRKFDIPGIPVACEPYGHGHINDTFRVTFEETVAKGRHAKHARYIVQRVNASVFANPEKVMENIVNVTRHLHRKAEAEGLADIDRRVLTLVMATDGMAYAYDAVGDLWRCYIFIAGAGSRQTVETPGQAFEAAKAYGAFQRDLMDYDGPRLFETIPKFHDTRDRMTSLRAAIEGDVVNRAASAKDEIAFALSREALACRLLDLKDAGILREHVTHNDTKLNNVLLDYSSGKAVCVVDLDTVMPGLCLYDFGDLVRSAVSPAAEDERDLAKVAVALPVFEALAKGYLEGAGGDLAAAERENLVAAAELLAFECGVRFLTDYLAGDAYFRIQREAHNLDRCRTQFALLRALEESEGALASIVMGI